jgi:hypothetical protein
MKSNSGALHRLSILSGFLQFDRTCVAKVKDCECCARCPGSNENEGVPAVYGKKESGLVVFGEPTGSPFRCGFESLFFSGRLFRGAFGAGLTFGSGLGAAVCFGFLRGAALAGFAFGLSLSAAVLFAFLRGAALTGFAFGFGLCAAALFGFLHGAASAGFAFGFCLRTTTDLGRFGGAGRGTTGHGKSSQTDQDTTHEIAPKR